MNLKENLKAHIIQNGWTMKQVVEELNKRNNKNTSLQNFSTRLSKNDSFRYIEIEQILDVLGYKIEWVKK